jgi:hypothetical protein
MAEGRFMDAAVDLGIRAVARGGNVFAGPCAEQRCYAQRNGKAGTTMPSTTGRPADAA